MKKKFIALMIMSILFVSGCGIPKLSNGEEAVATIDGFSVSANDIYEKMKKQYGTGITIDLIDNYIANKEIEITDEARKEVDTQIEMLKLQHEDLETILINYGYEGEEDFRKVLLNSWRKSKVVENYYKGTITEEEIQKYYETEVFGEMDARHILIIPEEKDNDEEQEKANEEALNKAKDLIKQLNEGADFAELAIEHSDDSSSEKGGLIEGITKDKYVAEFFDTTYALKNNEYTKEPVKSTHGYHIILKVSSKEKPSLTSVKDNVSTTLANKIIENDEQAGMKAWVEVRKKYNIEIFDKNINKIYNNNILSLKEKE